MNFSRGEGFIQGKKNLQRVVTLVRSKITSKKITMEKVVLKTIYLGLENRQTVSLHGLAPLAKIQCK